MRKTIALLFVFSIINFCGNLYAKEARGASVEIYKTKPRTKMEGTPWQETALPDLKGELIAVKQNSLLLKDYDSGADVSVDIKDVYSVVILKTPKTSLGAISGLIIGVASGTYIGYRVGWRTSAGAMWGGVIGGVTGVLAGAIIGSQINRSETYQFAGKSDTSLRWILDELRKKARVKDFQ